MGVIEIIGSILLIISCILIVIVIAGQSSKSAGLSSAFGMQDTTTNAGRNRAKTLDAMLIRLTKILAIILFAITLVMYALQVYLN